MQELLDLLVWNGRRDWAIVTLELVFRGQVCIPCNAFISPIAFDFWFLWLKIGFALIGLSVYRRIIEQCFFNWAFAMHVISSFLYKKYYIKYWINLWSSIQREQCLQMSAWDSQQNTCNSGNHRWQKNDLQFSA